MRSVALQREACRGASVSCKLRMLQIAVADGCPTSRDRQMQDIQMDMHALLGGRLKAAAGVWGHQGQQVAGSGGHRHI